VLLFVLERLSYLPDSRITAIELLEASSFNTVMEMYQN